MFHKYRISLFVNGIENVAVYGPYKVSKKIIGVLEALPFDVLRLLVYTKEISKHIKEISKNKKEIQSDL